MKHVSAQTGIFSTVSPYRARIFSPVKRDVIFHVIAIKFQPGLRRPLFYVNLVISAAEKFGYHVCCD